MAIAKDEDMKIRVPAAMRLAFQRLADRRLSSESQLARQAFLEFLDRNGFVGAEFREVSNSPTAAEYQAGIASGHVNTAAGTEPSIQTQPVKRPTPRRPKRRRPQK